MSIEDSLYKFLSFYKEMPDWAKRLLASPFKIVPRAKLLGKKYNIFYEEAKMLEFATQERIEEYQFLKLQSLLRHAFDTIPFYQETWKERGIDIAKIKSFQDFHNTIPFVTREMVQDAPARFLSGSYKPSQKLQMNSGGSTGIPLTLYYLKGHSRAAEWAHMHLQWSRVGYKVGRPMATLRGDYIGKNRIYSYDPWRNILILSSFNLNKTNADIYLDLLSQYKIEYINAYPASLYNLVQLSEFKEKIIPSLKGILLGSENVFEWQLQRFREFFNIDRVFYWYGHGELCALGGGCEISSNYHFLPSYSYVEFLSESENGRDATDMCEIIGTSFINPLMPLIRYRTQDYGIVAANLCECGRKHKQLSQVIGREQEIAVGLNGEKITLTALIFGRHADYFNHIIKMQIINTEPGKLIVKVIPKESFSDEHIAEIEDMLSQKQGMPFQTKAHLVNKIDGTKRGKHRFLIRQFRLNNSF